MQNLFRMVGFLDILDIIIVSYLFYSFFTIIRGTRAMQLLIGVGVLIAATILTYTIKLDTISWILNKFWTVGIVALIIVFQPEVRRALVRMGEHPFFHPFLFEDKFINKVIRSVVGMARIKRGALLVFERNTGLEEYIESGVKMDSEYSQELVFTIFSPNTPLHDGAVIVRGSRIIAAGCLLPLTDNPKLSRIYGTRHRAAIGLSEETDALVVVVSEETGDISIVVGGKITPKIEEDSLKDILLTYSG
jgi:diadenylate cyclase